MQASVDTAHTGRKVRKGVRLEGGMRAEVPLGQGWIGLVLMHQQERIFIVSPQFVYSFV